jgi:WD40 repeat protein/serine/threonine protein kinase
VCHDLTRYHQLAAGQLAADDEEALLAHLERCEACAQKLKALGEPDQLARLIRQACASPNEPAAKPIARLVERLSKLRPGETSGIRDQETLPPRESAPPPRLTVACPGCGKAIKVKPELAGKMVKCPHCQKALRVPGAATDSAITAKATAIYQGAVPKEIYAFLAPPQAPDEIGRLGPYRVLQVLGAGGMGVVFRAEDPRLARPIALKAMLPTLATSDSARQRFLREARAAAALKHHHIVIIHQVGEDRGVPFLAMEFLEGEPLDARLQREGKLPVAEVLRLGGEIALGLAAAHRRDFIHRDIKPANIWLEAETGRVKILDFGLARTSSDGAHLTQQGAILGTPAYMAPEQAQGKPLDGRCDLFSLGCVLYRLATGRPAFQGSDIVSTLMAVATEEPQPPRQLDATVPPALSDLIMSLLAKQPGERPASAHAVAEALQVIAREPHPPASLAPAPRNKRTLWLGSAAGLLLVALIGLWASGVLRVQTSEGTIVFTDLPADAEVLVDGHHVTLKFADDGKTIEVQAPPGKRFLEIKAPGCKMQTREVSLAVGERHPIGIRLEPIEIKELPVPVETPKIARDLPTSSAADALRRADIPEAVLAALGGGEARRAPAELVAVLGDMRFRLYTNSSRLVYRADGKYLAAPDGNEAVVFDAVSGHGLRRLRHPSWVNQVALSPRGDLLATASGDSLVRLWDLNSGRETRALPAFRDSRLCFSPDGTCLAFTDEAHAIQVWDWSREKIRLQIPGQREAVCGYCFSPQGREFATAREDGSVRLWDLETGQLLHTLREPQQEQPYWIIAQYSSDGKYLATGYMSSLHLWDVGARRQLWARETPALNLAFAPDGKSILSGSHQVTGQAHAVKRWQVSSGEALRDLPLPEALDFVWFDLSPDGSTLAFNLGQDRVVHRCDAQTGELRLPDLGHTRQVKSVAFSPVGRWLATGSQDGTARLWDLATGRQRYRLEGHSAPVMTVAFHPDGKMLATSSMDGTIALWDPDTGKQIRVLTSGCRGFPHPRIQFSPDGRLLAQGTEDGAVRLWDASSGETYKTIPGLHHGLVRSAAISSDGKWLVSGGADGRVVVSELASGKVLHALQHKAVVCAVGFDPKQTAVVATYDHPEPVVRVWEFATGKVTSLVGHGHHVVNFSLRPDGRLLASCSTDGSVRLWEMAGESGRKYVLGMGCFAPSVPSLAFSPDGRHLATGNGNGTVYLFRLPGLQEPIGAWMEAKGGPPLPGLSRDAWLKRVKELSPGNQAQAVVDRLRELNPGFDGRMESRTEEGQVVSLRFTSDEVKDISPVRVLSGLQELICSGSFQGKRQLADLTPLQGMKLKRLGFAFSSVRDLTPLKDMPLDWLDFGYSPVSDLAPLKDLKLKRLVIWHMPVDDAALARLQGIISLRDFQPVGTRMTDAGFVHLKNLTDLEVLNCGRMKLSGSGLVHLQGMTRLQILGLGDTEVTDAALVHLKGLLSMRRLYLNHSRVTDTGLEHLAVLKNLVELNVTGTAVTDRGVARLKAALPACKIIR